jgi:hypothetical protein
MKYSSIVNLFSVINFYNLLYKLGQTYDALTQDKTKLSLFAGQRGSKNVSATTLIAIFIFVVYFKDTQLEGNIKYSTLLPLANTIERHGISTSRVS